MSQYFKQKKITNIIILISIILIDQFSKEYFYSLYLKGNSTNPIFEIIPGFLDLSLVKNFGIAFGIPVNGLIFNLLTLILLISLCLLIFSPKLKMIKQLKDIQNTTEAYSLPLTLILSGGVGNIIDRITQGYVIDFISFSFWPAFNIADSAISIGAFILIYQLYKDKKI